MQTQFYPKTTTGVVPEIMNFWGIDFYQIPDDGGVYELVSPSVNGCSGTYPNRSRYLWSFMVRGFACSFHI